MSIDFRKRDYYYDGDDSDDNSDEEAELPARQEMYHKASAVPEDWVLELYEEMKEVADFHAVEIFNKCDPMKFAEFVSMYTEKQVFSR